ncbi:XRE family transcriptional regulator [Muricauda sp. SCSIO 64092]|uniref:XRE family transcriptional regulator n=1 Tax=Allomuricauda sp. SCSIO 64092 TaxID=2908842 RepID=UPI001FF1A681|nr:XRE family transcriptional regulator [Muricauda sp. SCSIO 64092]UOY06146.1 XRE family transcriptional regulator [Muricauda sp. SCSIO 64092]
MEPISNEEYINANQRLEELVNIVDDNTPMDSTLGKEFLKITDIIEKYESIHYPMEDLNP